MADTVLINAAGGATESVAADDINGQKYQRVKVTHGFDGSAADTSAAAPLPVYHPTNRKVIETTNTALGANASWVSGLSTTDGYAYIIGSVFANQAGTLYIEQSWDGVNWDVSTFYSVAASDGKGFVEAVLLPYARVRYVNGASIQTTFRLAGYLRA